jgi:membrane protease YdiL (CAAX protease family)
VVAQTPAYDRRADTRLAVWLGLVVLFSILGYIAYFSDSEREEDVFYSWDFAVIGIVQSAVFIAIMFGIAAGLPKREFFALRHPDRWRTAVGRAALVFVGTLVLGAVVGLFLQPGEEQGLTPDHWDEGRAGAFAANLFVASVVVPISEELTFRGAGYTLLARFGRQVAIPAIGILFALMHGLVEAFLILAVFGAGLGWLRARFESVYPCMLLHGFFNFFAVVVSVLAGEAADG